MSTAPVRRPTEPMQGHRFSDGSYVGHKMRVNSNISTMHFSAWFTADGDLRDCEAFDATGRARPVPPKVRKVLATMFGWVVAASKRP